MQEPPETPAPLFAVRAIKSAIFGTPHLNQSDIKHPIQPKEPKSDVAKNQPAEKVEGNQAHVVVSDYTDEPVAVLKVDSLASPTKGILLTPGTGANRRKTVSFKTLVSESRNKEEGLLSTEADLDSPLESRKNPEVPEAGPGIQHRQSSLTKTLIQLSKQNPSKQPIPNTSIKERPSTELTSNIGTQTGNTDQNADSTMDLSQPYSRSGQHWKSEYEKYHKRSNREMKKIIMYGQSVKSYAVKKDSEATSLGEKLRKELVKVAAMEEKVSKLAAQLNNAYAQNPKGESEQTRLVSELAQQTALAIRYKQKADHYRRAMHNENRADGSGGGGDDTQFDQEAHQGSEREAGSPEAIIPPRDNSPFQAQLQSLRISAKKTEDQAAILEAENQALKRSLARVKGEMMSYESRRQAREERLKRREAKCKADQKACEAQLAKLTVEHQNLLLASSLPSQAKALAHSQPAASNSNLKGLEGDQKASEAALASRHIANHETLGQNRVSKPHVSPRKSRLQTSAVDIWTLSSPRSGIDIVSPSKEPTELPPSSVRHDIQRTLKEIDQNLIPEHQPKTGSGPKPHISQANDLRNPPTQHKFRPQPDTRPPVHHTHKRKPTISSPRPAVVDLTSSPTKAEPSNAVVKPTVKKSTATLGRSLSMMSRVGSRTSTMTSARGSALPAERAAAAKARLAVRSAEKRKGQDGRG